jgi:hypothetical protein
MIMKGKLVKDVSGWAKGNQEKTSGTDGLRTGIRTRDSRIRNKSSNHYKGIVVKLGTKLISIALLIYNSKEYSECRRGWTTGVPIPG